MKKFIQLNGIVYSTKYVKKFGIIDKTMSMEVFSILGQTSKHYAWEKMTEIEFLQEYQLIQIKKSKLSSMKRKEIIDFFNRNYKEEINTPCYPCKDNKPLIYCM